MALPHLSSLKRFSGILPIAQTILEAYLEIEPMKIVLQERKDWLYLKADGNWTSNYSEALGFEDTDDALAYCSANKLRNVQVVFKFPNHLYDLQLPVRDNWQAQVASA